MKKNKILIILAFLSISIARAQSFEIDPVDFDTINQITVNGKKTGKWIVYKLEKSSNGKVLTLKSEEGAYRSNKKEGAWKTYFSNGNCKDQINYKAGSANGSVCLYHKNGKISEIGFWAKEHWVGSYKSFYENGKLKSEFNFNDKGQRNGVQKYYYENGSIAKECYFVNGKEKGTLTEYTQAGGVKGETKYKKGKVVSATLIISQQPGTARSKSS
jgi:antitoxin component YwqK of YwqJK toxin-antitoxin module